jgi:hypothetical protein
VQDSCASDSLLDQRKILNQCQLRADLPHGHDNLARIEKGEPI